jgi:CRISPR-associated protein Csm1
MREQFGTRLYLADGYTACTANDLINHPAEDAPYKEMFARVSRMISTRKMSRYSAEELRELNSDSASEDGRECKICGTRTQLTAENKCYWCQLFEDLSSQILYKDVYLISLNKKGNHAIALPSLQGTVYLTMTDETEARKQLGENEDIVRVYTKNRICTGLAYATKLYVGDYHDSSRMDELGAKSTGIPRNAVCRMDVDNLGKAFISGFEQNSSNPAERYKFVTLSRTATFSRQMSLFFKFHINSILRGGAVTIVYSGGDDVFLVGAWDAVIEAAQKIQEDFDLYTCGTLSLSAGITINEVSHPIRRSASESQKLEDYAKHVPGKNAVALFEASDAHTYHWDEFRDRVVDEKLYTLEEFFDKQKKRDSTEDSRGKAFIYRMLDLLRNSEDKINLARFAYLLARMEPSKENRDYAAYAEFSQKMYRWYLNEKDRKELITAIYIYVYQTRNV